MTTGGGAEQALDRLAAEFAALTAAVLDGPAEPPDADRVVQVVARAVPNAEYAALTLLRRDGPPETLASSGQLACDVDAIQYATGEGPCLQAAACDDVVRADDLTVDTQWPRFAARAVEDTGVRSMCGVRMLLAGPDRGALNLYATTPHAFTDLDVAVGAVLSSFASVALRAAAYQDRSAHLSQALQSNRQIGMAIGVLMGRDLLTEEQAFARLREASQHLNRKLRDIAAEVTRTGVVPGHIG